jgi:hypothetical protein
VAKNIPHTPLQSSNILSAGYDSEHHELEIVFKSGDVYRYEKVPELIFNGLVAAPSPGKFLAQFVKDIYSYRKLATRPMTSRVSKI